MKQTDPMEEAYKQLDGEPAGDAVSKAAKGEQPETDVAQIEKNHEDRVSRYRGEAGAKDIDRAYAMLFESLAIIASSRN